MAVVPGSALGSSCRFQFLLLTFHLPLLDGLGEGCPFRGSPGPHMVAPPHTHSTSKGLPSAHLLRSLPMLCSPLALSPTRPTSSLDQGLLGAGAELGAQEVSLGGGQGDAQLPHVGAPWGRGPEEGGGVPGGYFSIFYFQIFLYLNLQICIIPG